MRRARRLRRSANTGDIAFRDTNTDTDRHTDANADAHCDPDVDADTDRYTDTDADANAGETDAFRACGAGIGAAGPYDCRVGDCR